MWSRLLVFCGLADDSQGVLAAVYEFALVGIERCLDFFLCVIWRRVARLKLRIAAFADAYSREWGLHDSQLTFLHDRSLAHLAGRA